MLQRHFSQEVPSMLWDLEDRSELSVFASLSPSNTENMWRKGKTNVPNKSDKMLP